MTSFQKSRQHVKNGSKNAAHEKDRVHRLRRRLEKSACKFYVSDEQFDELVIEEVRLDDRNVS